MGSLVHEWLVEEHVPKGRERKGGSGVRAGACPGLAPGGDVYVMRGVGPLRRHGRLFGRRSVGRLTSNVSTCLA